MFICHICSCSVLFRGSRKQLFHFCAVLSRNQPKPPKPPTPAERLKYLRSAERNVAILAGVSLVIGYFALKKAFSDMAANRAAIPLPRPLVVAGPSGSGKSTLLKKLFAEFPDEFGFSISHTSRKSRPGEKNGREYYFSTREDMQKGIDNGEFIEWAEYSANLYGTSKKSVSDVQAQGRICVLDIDMQGVRSMKKTDLNPVYLFINPPSIEELEKRLRGRETETEESIQRRLKIAKEEMEYAKKPGVFDHIIINEIVHEAYDQMREVLMKEIEDIRKRRGSS